METHYSPMKQCCSPDFIGAVLLLDFNVEYKFEPQYSAGFRNIKSRGFDDFQLEVRVVQGDVFVTKIRS